MASCPSVWCGEPPAAGKLAGILKCRQELAECHLYVAVLAAIVMVLLLVALSGAF
jgi:hypothetical protein